MTDPGNQTRPASNAISWLLIALGAIAAALGLWDLLVERDGGDAGTIAAIAAGLAVLALGVRKRST